VAGAAPTSHPAPPLHAATPSPTQIAAHFVTTPHGTDAGYWIPYFTQRPTTASVMIFSSLADSDHRADVVSASQQVELLESEPGRVATLAEIGVDYIYIGQRGDFASPGLQADILRGQEGVEEVYTNERVSIFRLTPPQ
jgi:hypothetical protein